MSAISVAAVRSMAAPATIVYSILSDYHAGHPSILPDAFTRLEVLEGGTGAGTRIEFDLKLAGRINTTIAEVDEPEPGRILREVEVERGLVTVFTVDSTSADRCAVEIRTTWTGQGLMGLIERLLAPRMLKPLYDQQLENLEKQAIERFRSDG